MAIINTISNEEFIHYVRTMLYGYLKSTGQTYEQSLYGSILEVADGQYEGDKEELAKKFALLAAEKLKQAKLGAHADALRAIQYIKEV